MSASSSSYLLVNCWGICACFGDVSEWLQVYTIQCLL